MTIEQLIAILEWPIIMLYGIVTYGYTILAFKHPKCTIVDKTTSIVAIIWLIVLIIIKII